MLMVVDNDMYVQWGGNDNYFMSRLFYEMVRYEYILWFSLWDGKYVIL